MTHIKLGSSPRTVLVLAQLDAEQSVATIAKQARLKTHVVNYHLTNLTQRGVLRRGALLNLSALGFEKWILYWTLASRRAADRAKALKFLAQDSRVAWYGELGGDFQIATAFHVQNSAEVSDFVTALTRVCGGTYRKKALARSVAFTSYSKSYLLDRPQSTSRECVVLNEDRQNVSADKIDRSIMQALFSPDARSRPTLAKRLGIPRSTLEYRIARLREQGVLLREVYFLSAQLLGILLYRVLITIRGLDQENAKRMHNFCLAEPNIVNMTRCLGSWDFELALEVYEPQAALALVDRLFEHFADDIIAAELVPVFAQGTSSSFLK